MTINLCQIILANLLDVLFYKFNLAYFNRFKNHLTANAISSPFKGQIRVH